VVKSIAEYTAEVSKSYDNSRKALQNQIDAISGNLAQTQKQINENYAQQQNTLNNQRNMAASNASMQAAGSGGSFGGAANIANKKYYEQTFVPAQTQLNTNQSQALENAQSQANNNRLTLESQLASMNDEISRIGLQRYYDELERERQAELQRRAIAAQQAANYASYLGQSGGSQNKYNANADASGGFFFTNNGNGKTVKYGTAYFGNGGAKNNNSILSNVGQLFGNNSNEYRRLSEILKYNGKKSLSNAAGKTYNYSYLSKTDSDLLNRLGLRLG
jgi:hypothetical protein